MRPLRATTNPIAPEKVGTAAGNSLLPDDAAIPASREDGAREYTSNWQAEILLVDDDPANLLALKSVLEPLGQKVLCARSGEEALRHVLRHNPAIILLDVRMPGMSGFEIARLVRSREKSRHTPIIFLTGVAGEIRSAIRGYEVGAVDYLTKPIVPEFLRSKVSVFVELQRKNTVLAEEVRERRLAEEHLRESEARLRVLATRLVTIREEERARIAREIHDELGQVLTGLRMDVSWLARKFGTNNRLLTQKTRAMTQLIDSSVDLVRRVSTGMRPEVIDHMGLIEAIHWQAREFQKRTGIRCRCKLLPESPQLGNDATTAVFRIFQELLTNISRHAHAGKVSVTLDIIQNKLLLEVADDGLGISAEKLADAGSIGIIGMRERAQIVRGELLIDGSRGTIARLSIPLSQEMLLPIGDNSADRHSLQNSA